MLSRVQASLRLLRVAQLLAAAATFAAPPYAAYAQAPASPAESPPARDVDAVIASTEYKELVREGMLKYTRGFWPEARAYFLKAHELAPNARTLRGLALVCYDSHQYVDAIDYAEQSLAHTVQPLNDKMREELSQLVQQAQAATVHVELVTSPADAEVQADGKPVKRRSDGSVWLDPGAHELAFAAPGYWNETRNLPADTGLQVRLEVALKSRTAQEPTRVAGPASTPSAPASSTLPWVLFGVSTAVAAGGGVMLAVDQASSGDATALTPLGGVLLGVGAVGMIVSVTWGLSPRSESPQAATAHLQLSPLGVRCAGTF
jgi:hypothetical protein